MDTLFEHLRGVGEEKVKAIWQQAQAEVESHRREKESLLAEETKRHHQQGRQSLEELGRDVMQAAEEKARHRRAEAETRLAERLYELAIKELPWLHDQCGKRLLSFCAEELPRVKWGLIRVNESEIDLARTLFPEARTVGEANISGGLIAESADGGITVINTLEKRLERAWPMILPELFRSLHQEKKDAAS